MDGSGSKTHSVPTGFFLMLVGLVGLEDPSFYKSITPLQNQVHLLRIARGGEGRNVLLALEFRRKP